jgi:hypothetical protein
MHEVYALNPNALNAEIAYRRAKIVDDWPRRSGPRMRRWRRGALRAT